MDPAPPPTPAPTTPPAQSPVLQAWPRSAQLAAAALLGLATLLLGIQAYAYLRGGSRPTDLQEGGSPTFRVDLNAASRAELLQLPGVGESLAQRIEDYRDEHRGFRSVDELTSIRGVGPSMLGRLRPWVYVVGEKEPETAEPPKGADKPAPAREKEKPAAKGKETTKAAKLKEPIDLNKATAEELQTLPGIGPKLAQRILDERERKPFKSVDDLRRVPGIGAKTLERLRPYVTVDKDAARVAEAD